MNELHKADLQFKLLAYGGWNTATNTTGFLLGTGMLTKWMDRQSQEELMLTRYLEDWGYQANVRQSLASAVWSQPGYNQQTGDLNGSRSFAAAKGTELLKAFAQNNIKIPAGLSLEKFHITHPWNRLFECAIFF